MPLLPLHDTTEVDAVNGDLISAIAGHLSMYVFRSDMVEVIICKSKY